MTTLGYELGVHGRRLAEARDAPTSQCFGGLHRERLFHGRVAVAYRGGAVRVNKSG